MQHITIHTAAAVTTTSTITIATAFNMHQQMEKFQRQPCIRWSACIRARSGEIRLPRYMFNTVFFVVGVLPLNFLELNDWEKPLNMFCLNSKFDGNVYLKAPIRLWCNGWRVVLSRTWSFWLVFIFHFANLFHSISQSGAESSLKIEIRCITSSPVETYMCIYNAISFSFFPSMPYLPWLARLSTRSQCIGTHRAAEFIALHS